MSNFRATPAETLFIRTMLAMILAFGLVLSTDIAADTRSDYQQGMAAFKDANYQQALRHFQQAEERGMSSVTLHYNLGATHYRLGNYEKSKSYFTRASGDPKWGALAEYNLGLIAERQKNNRQAVRHYKNAYKKSDSEKVKQLANQRLNELTGSSAAGVADEWAVYLSGALGRDDNPALVQDTQVATTSGADTFLETIGYVSGYLSGGYDDGVRLSGSFYSRNYSDMSEFSLTGLDVGIFLDSQSDNWRFVRGARVNSYWIDGNQYSTGGGIVLQATQRHQGAKLDIKNELAYLSGGTAFDYISGIRNRFNIDLFQKINGGIWRIGYRNEFNDRDDLFLTGDPATTDDDQFFSYSPMRHSLYGQIGRELSESLSLRTRLEYRKSQYSDANREVDAETGAVTAARRDEDRIDLSALLRYSINKTVSTFAEYRYTDNDTNFDRFTYKSNQFMVGIDAIF